MPGGWALGAGAPLVLLAAVVALALVVAEWRGGRGVPVRARRVLLALRVATAVLGWALVAEPGVEEEVLERGEGRLAVLVDVSASMALEAPAGARAEALRGALTELAEDPRVRDAVVMTFGDSASPTTIGALTGSPSLADGQSRLDEAIGALIDAERGALGAVLLVTDGRASLGSAARTALLESRARVSAVLIGEGDVQRDDAIVSVEVDRRGYLRAPLVARVTVRALGGGGGPPREVVASEGGRIVATGATAVSGDPDGRAVATIRLTPRALGRTVYTFSIPLREGDEVPYNNERSVVVDVVRDRLRVLLVGGRPSWDTRALRTLFERDPTVDLISFFILRTGGDLSMSAPEDLSLIPFPTDELFEEHLGSFDLIVLQNFTHGPYGMTRHLDAIAGWCERGGGLAMIGGDLAFSAGGYAGTPIEGLLPVRLDGAPIEGTFTPRVADGVERHPLVALAGADDPGPLWRSVAPIHGAHGFLGVPEEATVLLEVAPGRGATRAPLLAVGAHGRGRVLALGTDESWRWGMPTAAVGGDPSTFERFWARAIGWLTRDPTLDATRLSTDARVVGPGALVRVEVLARDEAYRPVRDRPLAVVLSHAGRELGRESVAIDEVGGGAASLRAPVGPGRYTLALEGIDAPEARLDLVVDRGGDELGLPDASRALVDELAEASGGLVVAAGDRVPERALDASVARTVGTRTTPLFDGALGLVVALALLGAEWWTRRALGRR